MAKVHFVKKARKDNQVVKAGESYHWWAFRYGGKHYSKTPPRQSQLTESMFLSTVWAVEESFTYDAKSDDWRDSEALRSMIEDAVEQVQGAIDQSQESFDNIPESLQYGPTGEMLQSRVDEGEVMISDYEDINLDSYDGEEVPDSGTIPEEFRDWIEERLEEAQLISYGGE